MIPGISPKSISAVRGFLTQPAQNQLSNCIRGFAAAAVYECTEVHSLPSKKEVIAGTNTVTLAQ